MRSSALFACSLECIQQTVVVVSKASGYVCVWGRYRRCKRQNSSGARSQAYSLPCARMSAKSFRLARQLPGDQQEAVREYKHRLCLDPSCRRHDTCENAKQARWEPGKKKKKPWDWVFLQYIIPKYILWVIFLWVCLQQSQRIKQTWNCGASIPLWKQWIGILFNSTTSDGGKTQLRQLIAEEEQTGGV